MCIQEYSCDCYWPWWSKSDCEFRSSRGYLFWKSALHSGIYKRNTIIFAHFSWFFHSKGGKSSTSCFDCTRISARRYPWWPWIFSIRNYDMSRLRLQTDTWSCLLISCRGWLGHWDSRGSWFLSCSSYLFRVDKAFSRSFWFSSPWINLFLQSFWSSSQLHLCILSGKRRLHLPLRCRGS